jgi:hypothetical protein
LGGIFGDGDRITIGRTRPFRSRYRIGEQDVGAATPGFMANPCGHEGSYSREGGGGDAAALSAWDQK